MSDWASLNGQRIVSATVTIPYYGAWVADVVMSLSTSIPTGTVTLSLSDLTLIGTVYRQFSFAGSRSARIVGGGGGWQKPIASRAYQTPAGVLLSNVLRDLASDCGEQIGQATQQAIQGQSVGVAFTREAAPAVRILKQLTSLWWIDSSGATQTIDRESLAFTGSRSDTAYLEAIGSPFNVIEYSGGKGRFVVATEKLSDWMPGRTFSSAVVTTTQSVGYVTHVVDGNGKARTSVLAKNV